MSQDMGFLQYKLLFIQCVEVLVVLAVMVSMPVITRAAIDAQAYFPNNGTSEYVLSTGAPAMRITFKQDQGAYSELKQKYWNIKTPSGSLYTWRKDYASQNGWITLVTEPIWFGNDKSIIELGGYSPSTTVTGYHSGDKVTGIAWAGTGGIGYGVAKVSGHPLEMDVLQRKNKASPYARTGQKVYSHTYLIEHLGSYTLDGGNFQTYSDVIHLVMYHGSIFPGKKPVRCWNAPRYRGSMVKYAPFKTYNTHAIELWVARGIGIIKQEHPYFENIGNRNGGSCIGSIFSQDKTPYVFYKSN